MSEIKTTYIVLKICQILGMFFVSFWVARSKTDKGYWKRALLLILIWAVVDGLRFGRDQDYNSYYPRFVMMASGRNPEGYEMVFYVLCRLFGVFGLPYWTFIFTSSTLLITSCLCLFKDFRAYLPFIVLLMFWDLGQYDNLIRYYWAFPFFAFSVYYGIRGRKVLSFVLILCATQIHNGYYLVLPFVVAYDYLNKSTLHPYVSGGIYVVVLFLGNIGLLQFIADYAYLLDFLGSSKISDYASIADSVVNGEFGYNAGNNLDGGLATSFRMLMAYLPGIIWGKKTIENYRGGIFIYNVFVIGAITMPLFQKLEILDRLNSLFIFMSCIVNGILFGKALKHQFGNKFIYVICFACLMASALPSFSVLFKRKYDRYMLFLWNSNGRDYMPGNKYPMIGQ